MSSATDGYKSCLAACSCLITLRTPFGPSTLSSSSNTDAHVCQQGTLSTVVDFDDEESSLVEKHHLPFPGETKVCNSSRNDDLADELSTSIPDVHTVAAA